jgi:hypothetical protein
MAGSVCVYCGSTDAETVDHVPPRALFAQPRPSNLITVPCCVDCNHGFSLDDEYARLVMVLRSDVESHRAAQALMPTTIRGLSKAVLAAVRTMPVRTPSGLHLGEAPVMDVDLERLRRFASRVVHGLHFHQYSERLLGELSVWTEDDIGNHPAAVRSELASNILAPLYATEPSVLNGDVLAYWHFRDPSQPEGTVWLLQFFGEVRFLAISVPVTAGDTL